MIGTSEFPEGFRAGVRVRGWDMGAGRQPMTDSQRTAAAHTQTQLAGLIPAAAATEPVRLKPQDLDQIVSRVLNQLTAG